MLLQHAAQTNVVFSTVFKAQLCAHPWKSPAPARVELQGTEEGPEQGTQRAASL